MDFAGVNFDDDDATTTTTTTGRVVVRLSNVNVEYLVTARLPSVLNTRIWQTKT
jgi:hypothetical protein